MWRNLINNTVGVVSVIGYFINTIFWFIPIMCLSVLKLLPIKIWQTFVTRLLDGCATLWICINNLNQRITSRTHWDVKGLKALNPKDWYLIVANHQSWVDILVLQRLLNRRVPMMKFFLKKELIWVPFLGLAWWALDFPFMRRYSKHFLAKHPHLKGKDLETTRKACEKFSNKPVSIMNFVEGTRWTEHKHKLQNSAFKHLLQPKAGGIAFVLSAMGNQLHKLLDVTIHYPQGIPSFWDFVCGKVKKIQVQVKVLSIDDLMKSEVFSMDYFDNPQQRERFHQWLNQLWLQKDKTLEQLSASR